MTEPEPAPVLFGVHDVSLRLGGNLILNDLNFDIRDRVRPGVVTGQIVGLLGPSGVGKTRLLRIMAGLDSPDRGTVTGPKGNALVAGEVGVVFQDYPLLRHRTVLDNMLVAAAANGVRGIEARKRSLELLQRFNLVDRVRLYPMQLSGGQRQRVAIAQQIVCPKQLLLFDEPFSGLDPQALGEVVKLLVQVANMDELTTLVIVTHDVWAAMVACDTLFLLGRPDGGKGVGARIQETYDLVERGLAWREHVEREAAFATLEQEIRERFKTL